MRLNGIQKFYGCVALVWLGLAVSLASAQPGTVLSHQKISDTIGVFSGILDDTDNFGTATASLGDLDGDGVIDIVVGATQDDDGGPDRGAIWILFLNADGTVKAHQKISDTAGNFSGSLDGDGRFGVSLSSLGDLDGDGVGELAVGNSRDNDGGAERGAVWVLFLNSNGTVKTHQKISSTQGGFSGPLDNADLFGRSVSSLGDLDGDGITDLAVGAREDDDGGPNRGAVWILFLNANGTVKAQQKISSTQGGFSGTIDDGDRFGWSLSNLGDLDDDGIIDIAVGAHADDEAGINDGSVWILFLNADGTVKAHQKISALAGNFTGTLDTEDNFGFDLTTLPDLDGDGVSDLAVGAVADDDGGLNRGAVWILFLNTNGTVKAHQKISDTFGSFNGILNDGDGFGKSLAFLGDLNGDGVIECAAGAPTDDDSGLNRGAVWILSLASVADCTSPLGDFDRNCRIDLNDFAFFANRWMLDCLADPSHPACVPNDICSNAIEVFDGATFNGVTDVATGAALSSCGTFDSADVWHVFNPTNSGTATFSLCGSGFDTILSVFDGCGGNELACNDDFCSGQSQIGMEVTAGQPYYLRVAGNNKTTGSYTLNTSLMFSIAGNNCINAILLTEDVTLNGSTTGATGASATTCSSNDTADVWHSYTASGNGDATFSLCGSSFDTSLAIFDSCGGTELACNDDFCGVQSEITMSVLSGTTYLVRVAGFEGTTGDYDLLVTETHPANDSCSDPNVVIANVPFVGSSVAAAGSDITSCGTDDTADVWLSYTASVTATVAINLCGSDFDTTLAVFDSCGGTELVCNDDSCGLQSKVSLAVTSGTTYYLRIAGNNGATGNYTVNVIE